MPKISFQRTITGKILMMFENDYGDVAYAEFDEGAPYHPSAVFSKISHALELVGSEKAKLNNQ